MKSDPQVVSAHAFTDQIVGKAKEQSAREGHPVTCRGAGCSACCYEPVYCDEREIRHALSLLDTPSLLRVVEKTREWVRRVEPSGLLAEKRQPSVFAWRALRAECPFLHNNLCSIYPARPFACRWHMAVGEPGACADDALRPRQQFVESPDGIDRSFQHMLMELNGTDSDQLGAILARILLGKNLHSADRLIVKLEITT